MASLTRKPSTKKVEKAKKSYFIVGRKWQTLDDFCMTLEEYAEEEKNEVFKTAVGNPKVNEITFEKDNGDEWSVMVAEIPCQYCTIRFDLKKDSKFKKGQEFLLDSVRIRREVFPGEEDHDYLTGDLVE